MTPESIHGKFLPDGLRLLLPPIELVVSEELEEDPVIVVLREAATRTT
jgi:hypothetical protein